MTMKNPVVLKISKYLFKGYIIWSVCADLILIAGLIALLLGDMQIHTTILQNCTFEKE